MPKKSMSLLGAAILSLCFAACHGHGTNKKKTDCIPCGPYEGGAVRCNFDLGYYQDVCGPDQTLAAITCTEAGGEWEPFDVCAISPSENGGETGGETDETGGEPSGEPWDPIGSVTFDSDTGEYVIDRRAFEQLKRDPTPLLEDSSQLQELESGYYEVAKAGEVTSALGWLTGDVLLELDGYPLQGLDGLAAVYMELAHNTEFELEIRRGRAEVLLHYRVE